MLKTMLKCWWCWKFQHMLKTGNICLKTMLRTSRCVENVYVSCVENHDENHVDIQKKTTVTFNFLFQIFGIGHIYIIIKINKTLTLINTWHLYGVHCHILSIVTIFNIQRYPWHPEFCSCYSDRIFLWEHKDFTFVGPLRFRWCLPLVSKQSRSTLHLLHTMDFPDSPLLLHLLVS